MQSLESGSNGLITSLSYHSNYVVFMHLVVELQSVVYLRSYVSSILAHILQ